jgi:transposase
VVRSLEGNWRDDVLFELQQVVESFDFYQRQMAACDQRLQKYLAALPDRKTEREGRLAEPAKDSKKRRRSTTRRKNQPGFALKPELHRIFGVDLAPILFT